MAAGREERSALAPARMRASAFMLLIISAIFIALPVWAATPEKVIVSGGGLERSVVVSQPEDVDGLMKELCSRPRRGVASGETGYDIAIHWTAFLIWRGKLFRANASGPEAADVADWKMYTSDSPRQQTCYQRAIGAGTVAILERYGVPMSGDQSGTALPQSPDTQIEAPKESSRPPKGSYRGLYLPFSAIARVGVVVAVGYMFLRRLRRSQETG